MYFHSQNITKTPSAFGSVISTRVYASKEYRFGFNGMEKDDEIKGNGNHYNSEFRQYDPRLGRWFSIDPLSNQLFEISPYSNCFNNPIVFYDRDGNIGIFGALAAASWEVAGQVAANMVTGKPLNDIDWMDVGVAAVFGAVGLPPGFNKLSKVGQKIYKTGMNAVESGLQANFDWTNDKKFESTLTGTKSGAKALTEFGVSFAFSTAVGASKTYKRAVSNVDVKLKNQKSHTQTMQTKQASQEKSLANTQAKKQNVAQQEKVIKKSTNLNNTKQAIDQSKTVENTLSGAKKVVERTNSGIATGAAMAVSKTIFLEGYSGPSYVYTPEKMGNTGFFYMDKDHTTAFNPSTGMMYNIENNKLNNPRREHVDVTKKVLISPGKK